MSGTTTLTVSNATLRFSAFTNVTINGDNDFIEAANNCIVNVTGNNNVLNVGANSGGSLTGTNDTLNEKGDNSGLNAQNTGTGWFTVNLLGTNDYAGLLGGSATYFVDARQGGSGNSIATWANTTFMAMGSNMSVLLQAGDEVNIVGGGNTINNAAANTLVIASGTGGSFDTINANGCADGGTAHNNRPTGIYLGTDTQANVGGDNNSIHLSSGDSLGAYGGGNTIGGIGATNIVAVGGTYGHADTLNADGTASGGKAASGLGAGIYVNDGAQAVLLGSNNAVTLGTNAYLAVNSGTNEFIGNVNAGALVNLASNTSATVYGSGGTVGVCGTGINVTASNEAVNTIAGASFTLSGSGDIVALAGSSSILLMAGSGYDQIIANNSAVVTQGNTNASLQGSGNTVQVNADRTGTIGNTYLGLGASSLNNQVSGDNTAIVAQDNSTLTVNGNGDAVTVGSNSGGSLYGIDLVLNENGTGSALNIRNWDEVKQVSGTATVNLNGAYDYVGLLGKTGYQVSARGGIGDSIATWANTAFGVTGSNVSVWLDTGDALTISGGGNTVTHVGANDRVVAYNTNTSFDTIYAAGAAAGGTAVTGEAAGIYLEADTQANVHGGGNYIHVKAGDSLGALDGGGNTITGIGATNTVAVGGTGGAFDTLYADGAATGSKTANGQGTGIFVQENTEANIYGSGNSIAVKAGDSVGALGGGGNTITGIGATNTVAVGGTGGRFDTLYAGGAAFGGTASNHGGTGIFIQENTEANVYGSGNGIAVKAGDSVGALGGGGNTITDIGATNIISVGGTDGRFDTLYAGGAAFGGTASDGGGTGIFVQENTEANVYGSGNGIAVKAGDSVGALGGGNTITGIGAKNTISVGGTNGVFDILYANGAEYGSTASNGGGTGIFVQDDTLASILGDNNGVSAGSRDYVSLNGSGNRLDVGASTTNTNGSVTGTDNTLNEDGANSSFTVQNTGGGTVNVKLDGSNDYVQLMGGLGYDVTAVNGTIQGSFGTGFAVAGYNNTIGAAFGDTVAVIGSGNGITSSSGTSVSVQSTPGGANTVAANNDLTGVATAGGGTSGIVVEGGATAAVAGDGNSVAVWDGGALSLYGSGNAVAAGKNAVVGVTGNGNYLTSVLGGADTINGAYNNIAVSSSTSVNTLSTAYASANNSVVAIQSLYQEVFGRFASTDEIIIGQVFLAATGTLVDLRHQLFSGLLNQPFVYDPKNPIQVLYQRVLGRAATLEEATLRVGELNGVKSWSDVRDALAHTDEAAVNISNFLSAELGYTASAADVSYWQARLATDVSLATMRTTFAYSDEAAAAVKDIYQAVLGREVKGGELANRQADLKNGTSLSDLRWSLAQTGEAAADIQSLYVQVLGRLGSDGEMFDRQTDLALGQSLPGLRISLANTGEAASDIQAVFQGVMGRAATANEMAAWQQALGSNQGWTLAVVGPAVANVAINNFYQQVYGRDAPVEAVTSMKASLAQGTNLTTQFDFYRPILATSDYETALVNYFYASTFGRGASADEVGIIERAVSVGQSLATIEYNLTPEMSRQVKSLYHQDLGRDAEYADLAYWVDQANSRGLPAVSWEIAHTQESVNHVQALFQQGLHRSASLLEVAGFQNGEGAAAPAGAQFTVKTAAGAVLATVDARTLIAEAGAYIGLSGGVAPTLTGPDGQVVGFRNAYEFMGYALGLANKVGIASGSVLQSYGLTTSWLDQVGQADIQAAVALQARAKASADAGNYQDAWLETTGAQLAAKLQQQAPDKRGPMSASITNGQFVYTVTVTGATDDAQGLAGYSWTVTDTDPDRTRLIAKAQEYIGLAAADASNQLLAFLDNAEARVDLAYAALPKDARTDRMLAVAEQFVAAAYTAAGQGNWNLVQTLETAADASLQIAAMPEGSRHAVTERFVHKNVKHDITVYPDNPADPSYDPFTTFKDHSKGEDPFGAIAEAVVGVVINILAVIPFTAPIAAPLAVAWDTAQAGKNFAQGNILGGFLNLASAAAVGLAGLDAISTGAEGASASSFATQAGNLVNGFVEGTLGTTTATLGNLGSEVFEATALVGGTAGIVQSAKSGDVLGIAAGVLEVTAAIAGGLVSTGALQSSPALLAIAQNLRTGAGIASAAASAADAFANGNLAGGLATSLNALYSVIAQRTGESQKASSTQENTGAGSPATPAPTGGGDGATQEIFAPSTPSFGWSSDEAGGGPPIGATAGGAATFNIYADSLTIGQRLALFRLGILTVAGEIIALPATAFFMAFGGGTGLAGPVAMSTGVPGTSMTYDGPMGRGTIYIYDLNGNVTSNFSFSLSGSTAITTPNGIVVGEFLNGVPIFNYQALSAFAFPAFAAMQGGQSVASSGSGDGAPPPPLANPSGQATTPPGPEDPDGQPTVGPTELRRSQQEAIKKIDNIISKNAKEHDFTGVAEELRGGVTGFDHITEMRQSVVGLKDALASLRGSLNNPYLAPEVRLQLQSAVSRGQTTLDRMVQTLTP